MEQNQAGRATMQRLAKKVDYELNGPRKRDMPRANGFVIIAFPLAEPNGYQHGNYVGSGSRAEMAEALRAVLARWDAEAGRAT